MRTMKEIGRMKMREYSDGWWEREKKREVGREGRKGGRRERRRRRRRRRRGRRRMRRRMKRNDLMGCKWGSRRADASWKHLPIQRSGSSTVTNIVYVQWSTNMRCVILEAQYFWGYRFSNIVELLLMIRSAYWWQLYYVKTLIWITKYLIRSVHAIAVGKKASSNWW